jgi:hypothetical protein
MNPKAITFSSLVFLVAPLLCVAQSDSQVPRLLSPANGSQVMLSHVRSEGLRWEAVPGAKKYEIEITGPMSFNNGFPYTTSAIGTTFVFGQGGAIDTTFMGTYFWRVRAVFDELGEGGEGRFSEIWTFIVSIPPTPTPTPLITPTPNLDTNNDDTVNYRDLFYLLSTWSNSAEERRDLSRIIPHFARRNVTPTPTPTPSLAAPSSLRVLLDGQPVAPDETIPSAKVGSIVLDWEDVTGVEPITYDLSVAGPNPQASISYYRLSSSEIRPYSGYVGLYPGVYTWSVQAADGVGHVSAISTGRFQLKAGEAPPQVVDPKHEPEYDLDSSGNFQAEDLFKFSTFWGTNNEQAEYTPQADYNRDGTVTGDDAARLAGALPSRQIRAPQFTTIDIYDPPRGNTPATLNRTIPALPPLAFRIYELAFCEIHFQPIEGAMDYEVTLTGVTNIGNWPIGSRFTTGGQPSVTFMLSNRYAPTAPGSYHITVRAIDPRGIPGMRSIDLSIALSSY